jgi:hypothetical protein
MVRYQQASSSSGEQWHAPSRSFVRQQAAPSNPVRLLLPLPTALHVLTVTHQGESQMWRTCVSTACCTVVPPAYDSEPLWLPSLPALSSDGQMLLQGMPSGQLCAWDLRELPRLAQSPVDRRCGNAAASARWSVQPLTAVAVGGSDLLVAAGDAAGQLFVKWR